jgi:type I restriction enzyme S subunit
MEQLKKGYKKTELGVIPEDWDVRQLRQLSEKIMVGIASAATHAYRDKGIIMFRNQNIKSNYLDDSDVLHITKEYESIFKGKRLKAGDLLTARTGYPGTTCIVPFKYEGTQSFTTLITRPRKDCILSEYLCSYINSEKGILFFEKNQIGGGQKNVNAGTLKLMPIPIPTLTEQAAIADALTDVDELIINLEKLIAKKKAIKQGAMHQLLTPPDKGGKRLEGFSGDWEGKTLGELAVYKNGKAHESCVVDYGKYIIVNSKFISSDGTVAKYSNELLCPVSKDEILMVLSDVPNGKAIAKCYFVKEDNRYTLNQRICSLKSINVDAKFLYYLINRNKYFLSFDDGVKQTNLRNIDVLNCPLIIPPSIEEQRIIAEIITDMENTISSLELSLEKQYQIKQGMMQELLTGKTRLI